jgi:hypothetical protein
MALNSFSPFYASLQAHVAEGSRASAREFLSSTLYGANILGFNEFNDIVLPVIDAVPTRRGFVGLIFKDTHMSKYVRKKIKICTYMNTFEDR